MASLPSFARSSFNASRTFASYAQCKVRSSKVLVPYPFGNAHITQLLPCRPSRNPVLLAIGPNKYNFACNSSKAESEITVAGGNENLNGKVTGEQTELQAPKEVADPSRVNIEKLLSTSFDELDLPQFGSWKKFLVKLRMLIALPWRRVKKGSVLVLEISGAVDEKPGSSFSRTVSLPQLTGNLLKAAVDPRVSGLVLKIEPLASGWPKIEEIKRYIKLFKKSGKFTIAYITVGGEKEYYLATACDEIYTPPGAYISLRGISVQGQFLGGVLEKAGIEAQIERIGKYKSAGDQLGRKDMSEANREMLTAILDDVYSTWRDGIAADRGKTAEDVEKLLEEGVLEMTELKDGGWITDIKYESEVEALLKERLNVPEKKPLPAVNNRKYSRVNPWTVGLGGGGDRIAVIRAVGAISRGGGRLSSSGITPKEFLKQLKVVKDNDKIKALVLRIDSPGGDALASDLMWQAIRELAKKKPVVASMSDVAASGGYYMAMAAPVILAEELTLTGSIGVVTGKFNLGELYKRIGFSKEIISRGKYAQVDADQRSFTEEEEAYFKKGAQIAYRSFRDKAALSRSFPIEDMEKFAQGRVWTGKAAVERKLVDAVGGLSKAIDLAKQLAGIPSDKQVRILELSRQPSPLQMLLSQNASLAVLAATFLLGKSGSLSETFFSILESGDSDEDMDGRPQAMMEEFWMNGYSNIVSQKDSSMAKLLETVLATLGRANK